MVGIVAEYVAQLGDGTGEHAGGDVAMTPHGIQQLVMRNHLAGVAQQHQQGHEDLGLDGKGLSVATQGVRACINHDTVEAIALAHGWAFGMAGFRPHRPSLMETSQFQR